MPFPSEDVRISGERQRKAPNQCKISFGCTMGPKAPVQESRVHVGQTETWGCVMKCPHHPLGELGWVPQISKSALAVV